MALIDIVIPCYRYGRYLPECVGSILAQSMQDFRVLIIDDASPDDSATVAEALARSDERISCRVHGSNRGHIATYNEGIEWIASPYFLLLSADDFLAPGALERAVEVMQRNPRLALAYGACIDDMDGAERRRHPTTAGIWKISTGRDFIERTCDTIRNIVPTPTAIVRSAVQKDIGGYRPELHHSGDMEMWMRFAARGDVAETDAVQAHYRLHDTNMSKAAYRDVVEDYVQRRAAFDMFFCADGPMLREGAELHRLASRRLGDAAFWTAASQLCRGNLDTARQLRGFARSCNPRTRFLPPAGYLLRVENPLRKASAAIVQRFRGRHAAETPTRLSSR